MPVSWLYVCNQQLGNSGGNIKHISVHGSHQSAAYSNKNWKGKFYQNYLSSWLLLNAAGIFPNRLIIYSLIMKEM